MDNKDKKQINIIPLKDSKIKKRKHKKSPFSREYKQFLNNTPKKSTKTKPRDIIIIKKKDVKQSPPKKSPVKQSPPKKSPVKQSPPKKSPVKQSPPKKPAPIQKRSITKHSKSRSKKPKRRSRRLDKKHLKNRRVSFRCYSKNKNKKIDQVIKETKTMKKETLKKKLKEKGIDIKSNQASLIRDMFIFSELGGIQIKRE